MDTIGNDGRMLLKLLSAANLRQRVIADNIANESTPGFKRHVVRFEELVAADLSRGRTPAVIPEPQVSVDTQSPSSPDGNNVNLETELAAMRENRLLYETYASILESRSTMLRAAITEGR